jgi:hypothetical protein
VTPSEKYLYHQIHPAKLLTDWSTGLLALYSLWHHQLAVALVLSLVPPPVASWLVIRHANLDRQRQTGFGQYVARNMTHSMEVVRLAGFVVMAVGAWTRSPITIVLGLAGTLFGWLRGLISPSRRPLR